MWDAVRRIFHQDDPPEETEPWDATAGPPLSHTGDGGDVPAMAAVTPSTAPPTIETGAPGAAAIQSGPATMPGDVAALPTETARLSPAAPADTVRISPPGHAPQGLAAEGIAPAHAERPGGPLDVGGIAAQAPDVAPSMMVDTPAPPSPATAARMGGVGATDTPTLAPGAATVSPDTDAGPGEVVVSAPVAEPMVPDATPPAISVDAPDTTGPRATTTETVASVAPEDTGRATGVGDAAILPPLAAEAPVGGGQVQARAGDAPVVELQSAGSAAPVAGAPPPSPMDGGATVDTGAPHTSPATPTVTPETAPPGTTAAVESMASVAPAGPVTLDPGTVVGGRYTIAGLLDDAGASDGPAYRAVDARSYERCWSCGSAQNGAGNRFCQNCGAPIQNHQVVLARTAAPTGLPGEVAHEGVYLHVQPERRPFGVEGMGIEVGAHSAEGPHHPNEDSYWYTTRTLCANSGRRSTAVALLADGMGGYAPGSGLISSRIASTAGGSIVAALDGRGDAPLPSDEAESIVRAGIAAANGMVLREIARSGEMGATLVAAVVHGDTAYIANIGDSRAYYVDPRGQATQVTRDQSLVAQSLGQGGLSEDDIYTAPGNNIILHAVGEERVEAAADWYAQPLEPDSLLILCSDGYWKTMRGTVISEDVLRGGADGAGTTGAGGAGDGGDTLNEVARRMVDDALARGSDDNTTVLLIAIS